jgi:hypothetical protein
MAPMIILQVGPDLVLPLLAVVFTAMGTLFVVVGVRTIIQVRRRKRTWIRYPGEAFDYVWRSGGRNSTQYWMLRWIDSGGVQRIAQNPHGTSGGTFKSFPFPVTVLVDPQNPRRAQVADGLHSGGATGWIFSVVGGMFAVVGLVLGGVQLALLLGGG